MRSCRPSASINAPAGLSQMRRLSDGRDVVGEAAEEVVLSARIIWWTIGRGGECPIKMGMRIGLLTHQWPGARMGGIGSAVAQTAGALASSGHDVHAFTLALPEDVRAELPSGFTV